VNAEIVSELNTAALKGQLSPLPSPDCWVTDGLRMERPLAHPTAGRMETRGRGGRITPLI
jgi:hypothetical protein